MVDDSTIGALERLAPVAKQLRAAGVLKVVMGGVELVLAPDDSVPILPGKRRGSDDYEGGEVVDPLDDPITYGGGEPPSFRERRRPAAEEPDES
jgi:hypothetical protein